MSSPTYAIDKKKKKALSEDPARSHPLVSVEAALAALFPPNARWSPQPAADDAKDALAYLVRLHTDPAARVAPDADGLAALAGLGGQSMRPGPTFSLHFHWGGPEWLLGLALRGGRYHWDHNQRTLVAGAEPFTNWDLYYALGFLLDHAPALRPELVAQARVAKLPLSDRSRVASLLEDAAWAGELVEEWIARGTSRAESWNNCMLLGLIDDPDRFERFVASFGDQIRYIGRSARLGRALDRLPAPVIEKVVVGLLDRGVKEKWKASDVEPWAKLLAHVRSDEAARAIAQWIGEKSVAKIASDYFRTHADLAPAALGPIAKGKGKAAVIAKAMLESVARSESVSASGGEEDAASSEAGEAPKGRAKASKGGAKASKGGAKTSAGGAKASKGDAKASKGDAKEVSLPAVLLAPPWLSKAPRVRPRLALRPIVERESYEPRIGGWSHRPQPDRTPEKDAKLLGGQDPTQIYDGAVFGLTDAVALAAVRDRPKVNVYQLDALVGWLGEALVPLAIRTITSDLGAAHHFLGRAVSPRLALPCARVALKRSGGGERAASRAWLEAHREEAILGLVPAALGDDEHDADVAAQTLRAFDKAGHGALLRSVAARYGDEALAAIEAVLTASPYDRYPSKLPPKAKWALPSQVGTLTLTSGATLGEAEGTTLVTMLQFSPIGEPYPGALEAIALATTESRDALARALFQEYLLAGSPPSHAWVLGAIGVLSPAGAIPLLSGQMRAWAADGKVSLLHDSLEVLAAIGSDEALVVVYDAGQRSRYDDTRDKVRDILEAVARQRGVTYEVLEDLLVPELGLESGSVSLELGARTLSVRLGDHLEAVLTDAAGATLAAFPRKAKADDPAKYDAAKARYAALVEAADNVGRGQVLRLERALRGQRRWSMQELREHVLPQPLVRHLARRLVWQVVGTDVLFRVAEDLSLADANDETLPWPAADAHVVLAHPVTAPGVRTFQSWIDDYRVIQPFAQVGREVHSLEGAERAGARFERAVGRKVPYLSVLALTLGMGWKPIPPGNHGIDAITRELVASDGTAIVARLAISPGLLFGAAKGRPEQTLGALTLETESREPVSFDRLDAITTSELVRDVMTA